MTRPRPLTAVAALALAAAAHLGGVGLGVATAHDGDGILVVDTQGPATGLSVPYVVRLTWENDGHAAVDSTVTATVVGADGAPHTPVVMTPVDEDGRYSATITYDSGGSWTVRFTAVTPTATIELVEEVAQPATTTTTTQDESPTTTESTTGSTQQAAAAGEPDDGGIGVGGVLAALFLGLVVVGCAVGFVRATRRVREDR